jgi:hypothetical protein
MICHALFLPGTLEPTRRVEISTMTTRPPLHPSIRPASACDLTRRPLLSGAREGNLRRFLPCLGLLLGLGLPSLAQADEASPYGINTHIPSDAALDLVQEAGIGWVRYDFNWFQIEPEKDRYDWSTTDRVIASAEARGLEVFVTLAYSPDWASGGDATAPPIDPADWYDFVFDVVSRYRGRVSHWGLWNEPNLGDFFSGSMDDYIQDILVQGAAAVRAADSGSKVLGPELAMLDSGDWELWLKTVLTEAPDAIDIVTQHSYSDTGKKVLWNMGATSSGRVRLRTPHGIMVATGTDDKPLWLTETGWHTDEVSESSQATFYEQTLDGVLDLPWLEKVFFYELVDDPNISSKWGILAADLSPKEAFFAYQSFIYSH